MSLFSERAQNDDIENTVFSVLNFEKVNIKEAGWYWYSFAALVDNLSFIG